MTDMPPESPEPYDLSPSEAADVLGCHEDTLKRWVRKGALPAFRTPGGWLRFRRSDLDAFLAAGLVTESDGGAA